MAYCPSCGNEVSTTDRFCGRCGAAQPVAGPPPRSGPWQDSVFANASSRNVSTFCYIPFVGWIAGLLVLAANRFRKERNVRFHAFQGLYLFVTWLLVDLLSDNFAFHSRELRWITSPIKIAVVVTWIYMLIQTSQGKFIKLPFLGELADRSVNEQQS